MLTHFGNFLCSLGEKGPFKTNAARWSVALAVTVFLSGTSEHNGLLYITTIV